MQNILWKPATVIIGRLHSFLCRNNHLELTVINDCKGTTGIIGRTFHTLNGTGQDTAGFLGLKQIEQVVFRFVRFSFYGRPLINGYHRFRSGRSPPSTGLRRLLDAVAGILVIRIRFCVRLR